VDHTQSEAVGAYHAAGDGERSLELARGRVQVALLLEVAGEVVARDRLLPWVSGLDREREQLLDPIAQVGDADVPEDRACRTAGVEPQLQILCGIGALDGKLGVAKRLAVGAGEEADLRLQRRDLRARAHVLARLRVALRLHREHEPAAQIATMQRDHALQSERPRAQLIVLERAAELATADRVRKGAGRILVVDAACAGQLQPRLPGVIAPGEIQFGRGG